MPDIFPISTANFPVDLDIIGSGSYFSQTYTSFPGTPRGTNTNRFTRFKWSKRALATIAEFLLLFLLGA